MRCCSRWKEKEEKIVSATMEIPMEIRSTLFQCGFQCKCLVPLMPCGFLSSLALQQLYLLASLLVTS